MIHHVKRFGPALELSKSEATFVTNDVVPRGIFVINTLFWHTLWNTFASTMLKKNDPGAVGT
jgi:hypothetical protein